MLGLPKSTELNRQLPKKAIYTKFQMNTKAIEKMDTDISRITIVNEVTPEKINVIAGEKVYSFFVIDVTLKKRDFDEKNIITLSKAIRQNLILALEFDGMIKLATFHTKLMLTQWQKIDSFEIELKGLNFDKIWENIIVQIGDINIEIGRTLDEQISIDEKKTKLLKEIERLEKMARTERQPKKKFELVAQVKQLQIEMEGYNER